MLPQSRSGADDVENRTARADELARRRLEDALLDHCDRLGELVSSPRADQKACLSVANELAYVRVNEKLIARLLRRLPNLKRIQMLDVGAAIGLMTQIAHRQASARGQEVQPVLLDLDCLALSLAKDVMRTPGAQYVLAVAEHLPFKGFFDAAIFANSIHLLDDDAKAEALQEIRRVLAPEGVLAVNSTFYTGAYPEESKPFYSRWMRRAIAEMNQRLPNRAKSW